MRKILYLILPLSAAICFAQQKPQTDGTEEMLGEARIGLSVSKPDDTTTTQLPSLPPGIGFVVSAIEKDGPADKAGVRKLDLLYKMNEQMLVNEGQLATLLRLLNPGDEVTLSVFREGKSLDLNVKLGKSSPADALITSERLNNSVIRSQDGEVRIVNLEQKKAQFSNDKGTVEVYRTDEGDVVHIVDIKGKTIFDGVSKGRPELSLVPEDWKREVCALRRGLDHVLSAKAAPDRKFNPRPRIVPAVTTPKVEE